jgi:hypothetical protein
MGVGDYYKVNNLQQNEAAFQLLSDNKPKIEKWISTILPEK